MALVPDQKFSTFVDGGDLEVNDIIVGLRGGLNTKFNYTGELPPGVVVPIINGGTGATTAGQARINLGLGTMAVQNATAVAITGGTLAGVTITASTAALTSGSVVAAPSVGADITNKTYVDGLDVGNVKSVSGTANRITSTGGQNPVINISASYVGQSSITTLGTVVTGVWNATVVGVVYGGTGLSSLTQGDLLYASAANTLSALAKNASATRYLSNTGTTNNPAWAQVDLTNGVTGNLPVTNLNSGTSAGATTFWRGDGFWAVPAGTGVTSVSGTANRITSTGGTTPVIDIAATYVGQTSITTLGTIATGVWQGTVVGSIYGGTGVNNGSSTITLGGSLTTSGAFASTFTMTGVTGVTFPTSGTLATTSQLPTPAALTRVDDTNVTLTLGGTPATALLQATSITVGWTGTLAEIRGGTAQSTYTTGDILYSSAANTLSKLAGNITTAKQYLSQTGSGAASAAPVWATISGADITGAALTKTDDTNVTLTLGGTPTTALLRAASLTLGWTGQLGLTRGGTAASLTASNGGIVYSTASALAILAGTATAGQMLQSGSSTTPAWSTTTYPATNAVNTLLYASSANIMAALATANSSVLVTSAGGVPSLSTALPSGLTATNMVLTTPTLGAATATTIAFSPTTGGVIGTTTNDNTSAGNVGEVISANATSGSLTNNSIVDITSISLTAGDWDVMANFNTTPGATTVNTRVNAWINTTSVTPPALNSASTCGYTLLPYTAQTGIPMAASICPIRISVSGTTTVYLSFVALFSVSTLTVTGTIWARRRR